MNTRTVILHFERCLLRSILAPGFLGADTSMVTENERTSGGRDQQTSNFIAPTPPAPIGALTRYPPSVFCKPSHLFTSRRFSHIFAMLPLTAFPLS